MYICLHMTRDEASAPIPQCRTCRGATIFDVAARVVNLHDLLHSEVEILTEHSATTSSTVRVRL